MRSTLSALVADVRWLHVVFQTNFWTCIYLKTDIFISVDRMDHNPFDPMQNF